jgi:hypothetical protein
MEASMTGTILDFLNLVVDEPDLARDLLELASRYGFEFDDELDDEELAGVVGGTNPGEAGAGSKARTPKDEEAVCQEVTQVLVNLSSVLKSQQDTRSSATRSLL